MDYLDIDSKLIPRIGTAIGAGVSLNRLLCGSVSSIAMLIGIKYGRNSSEENPQPVWDTIDEYVAAFKDRFGAVNCRQLTGLNLKTKEGLNWLGKEILYLYLEPQVKKPLKVKAEPKKPSKNEEP